MNGFDLGSLIAGHANPHATMHELSSMEDLIAQISAEQRACREHVIRLEVGEASRASTEAKGSACGMSR
jgi:hypothetical protein